MEEKFLTVCLESLSYIITEICLYKCPGVYVRNNANDYSPFYQNQTHWAARAFKSNNCSTCPALSTDTAKNFTSLLKPSIHELILKNAFCFGVEYYKLAAKDWFSLNQPPFADSKILKFYKLISGFDMIKLKTFFHTSFTSLEFLTGWRDVKIVRRRFNTGCC